MDKYDFLKLNNQLCFRLYATSREVIKLYKPLLDKYNLTYTQYVTMLVLWEEEKATVKDIGIKLHLDSGTLTPLLKKLENMGLIIRYRDKNDDRVVIAELTQKGVELKEEIIEVPNKMMCKIDIPKEQGEELAKNLDDLLKVL
ncbi:MarR family transcriptional regulator [Clostridium estertheticum]|uniref:MarR family winged helix-turn-helix transcriptional regulator n=1 Tax=Clostridium estertheticum TaxID=238834 RepID=UPI001C0E1B54|nr:MarR family transcriptional regulator [Clostridium estertheticum]MBU3178614.1 MarR family transcriptional regulator [Clostridium estertheticum]